MKIKRLLAGFCLLFTTMLSAQEGLQDIIVEKYYVSNFADSLQADAEAIAHGQPRGALPVGSVTYRIYAKIHPDYTLKTVFGLADSNNPLLLKTTTFFYNNPTGTFSPVPSIEKAEIKNKLLALDSYLTIGGVANGQLGVLKEDDNGSSNNITITNNPSGVLLNSNPSLGIPLTVQDGMLSSSNVRTPSIYGLTDATIQALSDGTLRSNTVEINDGFIINSDGASNPFNKVLIAQLTTNGILTYELNLSVEKISNHVSEDYFAYPHNNGFSIPHLVLSYTTQLTATITNPINNTTYVAGDTLTITAEANDSTNTVEKVEFFVDNISIGTDSSVPYTMDYIASEGHHNLTVRASNNVSGSVVSYPIAINVSSNPSNVPPVVILITPAAGSIYSFKAGDHIEINADAFDPDGSISYVKFLIDGSFIATDYTFPYSTNYIATTGDHNIAVFAYDNLGSVAVDGRTIYVPPVSPKGLENIFIEEYYISNKADSIQADIEAIENGAATGSLPVGSVTYRFYADMKPGYEILSVYADKTQNQWLKFNTTTSFYNNPSGSLSPLPGTSKSSIKNKLLALDSYLTLGGVATGNEGMPKVEDTDLTSNVTVANNPAGVLLNTQAVAIPLNIQDGMVSTSTARIPTFAGFSDDISNVLGDGTVVSDSFNLEDGIFFNTSGAVGPKPGSNRVLIAQLTTNGILTYELNLQIKQIQGNEGETYAAHPGANDFTIPSLSGTLVPPHSYKIETSIGSCADSSFCLPVASTEDVRNVIGYDIVLKYDNSKVHPTGTLTISNDLINSNYVSYAMNVIDAAGQINISVFLNANAQANTSFSGIGKLFCVEFTKKPGLLLKDTVPFMITSLQESYANGVASKIVAPGSFINKKSDIYNGVLKFWADNSPIAYDDANPSSYLFTKIAVCSDVVGYFVTPDINGKFQWHSNILGNGVSIKRDIASATNVQPVINGFDVALAHKVLINDLSFIPNVYQIIAMDVNLDGVVSAGDVSQMNQRSVKTIPEFKQWWNYDNNGNSNGQPSKDWLFVSDSLLSSLPYQISLAYPNGNGYGYSKNSVPYVPSCLPISSINATVCPIYEQVPYTGILLGDMDGNYANIPNDGQIKRLINNTGTVYLNLDKAIITNSHIDVPVSFASSEKIVSLDFAIKLNEHAVKFDHIVKTVSYLTDAMAHYAADDQTIRFTSNSTQNYEEEKTIAVIRFSTVNGQLDPSDLTEMIGYLNGKPVGMEIKGNSSTGISTSSDTHIVEAYPNPANDVLNIITSEKAVVELLDLQGREVISATSAYANEKLEINTSTISNGTYLLKVYNDKFVSTQRIVVENNR